MPWTRTALAHAHGAGLRAAALLPALLQFGSLPPPSHHLACSPTVAWLAAARHRARLVLDWHNFGFTLMGLGLGRRHWLVRLARAWERFWGRAGHAHFCVTRAMQQELEVGVILVVQCCSGLFSHAAMQQPCSRSWKWGSYCSHTTATPWEGFCVGGRGVVGCGWMGRHTPARCVLCSRGWAGGVRREGDVHFCCAHKFIGDGGVQQLPTAARPASCAASPPALPSLRRLRPPHHSHYLNRLWGVSGPLH